jgi:hypothetical protein
MLIADRAPTVVLITCLASADTAHLVKETRQPNFRQAEALETLAALLAEEGRTEESRRAYARAAQVYEAIGDAEASSRCHAAVPPAP